MSTLQFPSSFVKRMFDAYVRVSGFLASASSSTIITTPLTSVLASAGDNGQQVPVAVCSYADYPSQSQGVVTSAGNNRVEIYDATTKLKLDDGNSNELYGRVTESGGVYTLSYFSLVTGVETSYTFAATKNIDFEFPYCFDLDTLPRGALISIKERNVNDDSGSLRGRPVRELVSVTALNTLADLSYTPTPGVLVRLNVIGKTEDSGAGGAFSVTGKAIAWSTSNAGYSVKTTYRVLADYYTLQ